MSARPPDQTAVAIAVGEPLASRLFDGEARLEPVSVPGVDGAPVWSVLDELGDHPTRVYVGAWPDGTVRVLTADQDAWADLIDVVGVHLAGTEQAQAYVEAFLEITRGPMVIVTRISSVDELRWRPGSPAEESARQGLLADPPDFQPVAGADGDDFHVELTLVVDQRLQRNLFTVGADGRITSTFRVLADGLPLPIAR